jgi:hypothetical protein
MMTGAAALGITSPSVSCRTCWWLVCWCDPDWRFTANRSINQWMVGFTTDIDAYCTERPAGNEWHVAERREPRGIRQMRGR